MPLVDNTLVPELIKYPPDRFDVFIIQCYIGIIEIDPVTHHLGHLSPFLLIIEDRFLAFLAELLHTILFNGIFIIQAELLLHLYLDRQAVSIPSCLTFYFITLHRLVAADSILYSTGYYVMDAWPAVGSWRPFIKDEFRRFMAKFHALQHDPVLLPVISDPLFENTTLLFQINQLVHCNLS